MSNAAVVSRFETLGSHRGVWLRADEIIEAGFKLDLKSQAQKLELDDLQEGAIICFVDSFYEIFLEDRNRERFFVEKQKVRF